MTCLGVARSQHEGSIDKHEDEHFIILLILKRCIFDWEVTTSGIYGFRVSYSAENNKPKEAINQNVPIWK